MTTAFAAGNSKIASSSAVTQRNGEIGLDRSPPAMRQKKELDLKQTVVITVTGRKEFPLDDDLQTRFLEAFAHRGRRGGFTIVNLTAGKFS